MNIEKMENTQKKSDLSSEVVLAAHLLKKQEKQEMLEELKKISGLPIIEPPKSEGEVIESKPELKLEHGLKPEKSLANNVKEVE